MALPTLDYRNFAGIAVLLCCFVPRAAPAQTPAPLQEWQYPGGVTVQKLFDPAVPKWDVILGVAEVVMPRYDGAQRYHTQTGPVIDVRYRDLAFASIGEGIGVNILRGANYRAGIAIAYDFGRHLSDDPDHLRGFGNISAAPVIKFFGSYVISKSMPVVFRVDLRRIVGGADGLLGDLDIFMPLPGSSETLAMFAGPSLTFADHRYMQKVFGVTSAQAADSGDPEFQAHAGANAVGLGFSATRFLTARWLLTANAAVNRLLGSASASPITQSRLQGVLAVSVAYRW